MNLHTQGFSQREKLSWLTAFVALATFSSLYCFGTVEVSSGGWSVQPSKTPPFTIQKGKAGGYIKYKMDVGAADSQYSSCRVSYVDPESGKCIEATAKVEDYNADAKNNQQLEITAKVSSKDEARLSGSVTVTVPMRTRFLRIFSISISSPPARAAV